MAYVSDPGAAKGGKEALIRLAIIKAPAAPFRQPAILARHPPHEPFALKGAIDVAGRFPD